MVVVVPRKEEEAGVTRPRSSHKPRGGLGVEAMGVAEVTASNGDTANKLSTYLQSRGRQETAAKVGELRRPSPLSFPLKSLLTKKAIVNI